MATISHNYIARAIYMVLKDKSGEDFKNTQAKVVNFLARKRLLSKSKDILEKLDKIINREDERIVVKVFSKGKLKEESKKELTAFIKKRYKAKEVVLVENTDERLLGGVRIEINDEIIDLTVVNKVKKLQEYLTRKI